MDKRHVGFGRTGGYRWALPVLVAAMVALLASCGQSSEPQTGDGANGPDPGLGHVHGLGVEPGTGDLYAASHYGVFRLPMDGTPERIADRRQDTMGFTIVDQGHFLGSGRPALRRLTSQTISVSSRAPTAHRRGKVSRWPAKSIFTLWWPNTVAFMAVTARASG